RYPVAARGQRMAELVQHYDREHGEDEHHAADRSRGAPGATILEQRDPCEEEHEGRVHVDVDPGQAADPERPLHSMPSSFPASLQPFVISHHWSRWPPFHTAGCSES